MKANELCAAVCALALLAVLAFAEEIHPDPTIPEKEKTEEVKPVEPPKIHKPQPVSVEWTNEIVGLQYNRDVPIYLPLGIKLGLVSDGRVVWRKAE